MSFDQSVQNNNFTIPVWINIFKTGGNVKKTISVSAGYNILCSLMTWIFLFVSIFLCLLLYISPRRPFSQPNWWSQKGFLKILSLLIIRVDLQQLQLFSFNFTKAMDIFSVNEWITFYHLTLLWVVNDRNLFAALFVTFKHVRFCRTWSSLSEVNRSGKMSIRFVIVDKHKTTTENS